VVNGVRSCVVCPGEVATPILDKTAGADHAGKSASAWAQSEDVGDLIRYVACLPAAHRDQRGHDQPDLEPRLRRQPPAQQYLTSFAGGRVTSVTRHVVRQHRG